MREILFRGKFHESGTWVEGWYSGQTCDSVFGPIVNRPQIVMKDDLGWAEVIPETVGQYTGLCDKNGKKIFEGDILASENCFRKAVGHIVFGIPSFDPNVETEEPAFGVKWRCEYRGLRTDLNYWAPRAEVIGNIFDNPDLLGAE